MALQTLKPQLSPRATPVAGGAFFSSRLGDA